MSLAQMNLAQLIPPKAIRPRTFSTSRAPDSVFSVLMGAAPPSARLDRFNHRAALWRLPRLC